MRYAGVETFDSRGEVHGALKGERCGERGVPGAEVDDCWGGESATCAMGEDERCGGRGGLGRGCVVIARDGFL